MKFSKFGKETPSERPTPELGMNPALAEVREIISALRESATEMQTATSTLKDAASAFEATIKEISNPAPPTEPKEEESPSGQEPTAVDSS